MNYLERVFEDKRLAIAIILGWSIVLISVMLSLNILHSEFMTIGPSNHTRIMTIKINTWHKYAMVSTAAVTNCAVHDFIADAIHPWILNTIQDHKTVYLPYSKTTCYLIYQIWVTYCHLMGVFSWSFVISQIDFMFMRLVVDLLVKTYTTHKFMKQKVTDKQMYSTWNEENLLQTRNTAHYELQSLNHEDQSVV
jgi:large-conductance mechanosensitive channel